MIVLMVRRSFSAWAINFECRLPAIGMFFEAGSLGCWLLTSLSFIGLKYRAVPRFRQGSIARIIHPWPRIFQNLIFRGVSAFSPAFEAQIAEKVALAPRT